MCFLYNGQNDLASIVIDTLLREISNGGNTKLNLRNLLDRVLLADLTLRFSSEITPQVGPPFLYFIISRSNNVAVVRNDALNPINSDDVANEIRKFRP